jgi:hypothetical protein
MLIKPLCVCVFVCITFSKTLEKEIDKNIALKLEMSKLWPFLNTAFTIKNFVLVGKVPEETDLLHVCIKGQLIKRVLSFKILTEI